MLTPGARVFVEGVSLGYGGKLRATIVRDPIELLQLVRFVIADHLPPTPGRPLRVLPFARSVEDSCYFALDLARPAGSDFPVLFIPHDSVVDPAVED